MIGQLFGNYRAVALLGQGGMGAVYLAEHPGIGRRVAIKVLNVEFSQDPTLLQRFLNEARAANAIRHPNIIEILDSGTAAGGLPYLVMELLEGETLKARIQRLGQVPLGVALEFTYQTASAVGAAHRKAIIHRDLKPDNLFIITEPTDPTRERIKVLDFGIAKLQSTTKDDSVRTRTGTMMGTPVYMSPEQCLGTREIDSRTDVYSLGVILYEMLCGKPPFYSEGFGALVNMHLNKPPPPPRSLGVDLPESVEALVLRMLAKDLALRHGSMYEVQAALKALGDGTFVVRGASKPEFPGGTLPGGTMALPPSTTSPLVAPSQTTTLSSSTATTSSSDAPGGTPPRPRRSALIALVTVGAVAAVAGVVWRKTPPPHPVVDAAVVPALPPPPSAPMAPPAQPAVRTVQLSIASDPAGARVVDAADGRVRGQTPLELRLPAATVPLELRLEKDGYRPSRLSMKRDVDRAVTVDLTPRPSPRPVHHPRPRPEIEEPAKL
jgi:serine/threonine protein kinase